MQRTACRSCGAWILWTRTAMGKDMPIDAVPVPDGNIILTPAGIAIYDKKPDQVGLPGIDDSPRYVSHFVTCPDAGKWRK